MTETALDRLLASEDCPQEVRWYCRGFFGTPSRATGQATLALEALAAELERLKAENERLERYADKLADGLPEGMLPKDVELLRAANADMASRIYEMCCACDYEPSCSQVGGGCPLASHTEYIAEPEVHDG